MGIVVARSAPQQYPSREWVICTQRRFPGPHVVLVYRMPFVILSLSDRIHEYLRERLVSHELPPGEVIRQDALAAELGVSKIPIREALSRLVESNMVQAHANRGFISAPLSLQELEELFALRLLLEPPIAAETAVSADQVQRDQVKSNRDSLMRGADPYDDTTKLRRIRMLSLLHQPGRKTTMNILIQVFDRSERYHLPSPPPTGSEASNLRPLLSAWLKGDADHVRVLYRDRLLKRLELAKASLPS